MSSISSLRRLRMDPSSSSMSVDETADGSVGEWGGGLSAACQPCIATFAAQPSLT